MNGAHLPEMEPPSSCCPTSSSTSDDSVSVESCKSDWSLLLDLPRELRLMIYEHLLVHKGDLYFSPTYSLYHVNHVLYPQILSTCRLVNTEGTWVLYAKNKLVVDGALSMSTLCETIMPRGSPLVQVNLLRISNLSVQAYVELPTFLETLQSVATRLEFLQSLSVELDDVIMAYFAGYPQSPKYPKHCRRLRRSLLKSFRGIIESHPMLKRIVEVRYVQDVNYKYGMHFRLLGAGVKVSTVCLVRRRLRSLTFWRTTTKPLIQPSALGLGSWLLQGFPWSVI